MNYFPPKDSWIIWGTPRRDCQRMGCFTPKYTQLVRQMTNETYQCWTYLDNATGKWQGGARLLGGSKEFSVQTKHCKTEEEVIKQLESTIQIVVCEKIKEENEKLKAAILTNEQYIDTLFVL
jgi:uncharacterized protein YeaC (DUF1315 family)